ncbi:helix-turn-helix transcriptional regulator [Clostridium sp. AWRP]|uniref:helix-turn-helix transcriptional regulator n=1 Tax=Clostridium sp. AWRP TaxID=2212991 RepID=UPI000FDC93C3|nr:helix-turn-helix transcriptional regulator [Clostridium sp. AWRP]AZV58383.1 helix-turn-helix transcriptional regulator [Clostridium sp. AWRP]
MLKVNINKIILARAEARMTVRELSRVSKLAVSTINKIENGYAKPNPVTIGKLAKALNVEVEQIIDIEK